MNVDYKIFKKENIENTNTEYKEVLNIANELKDFLNQKNILQKIALANQLGANSAVVQEIILEKAIPLGFKSEKQYLFSEYPSSGLRPDYYKKINTNKGIIIEVERGKTLANNMDMLDVWKCHICKEANYLFLIVPYIRPTGDGKGNTIFDTVIKRMESFFKKYNYINIDALFIFGY
jgi:hypothetical protein